MLSKSSRVKRADFTGFFRTGQRHHSEYATLIFTPYPTFHGSVVVSKKVAKSAVTRNTLRRRVYSQLYGLKRHQIGGVYIVTLKPSFTSLTRKQASAQVDSLLVRTVKST